MTKNCFKCGIQKDFTHFYIKKDGTATSICKPCRRLEYKDRYVERREKQLSEKKSYYSANAEKIREYKRQHYLENKELYKIRRLKKYGEHREKILANMRKIREEKMSPERREAMFRRRGLFKLDRDAKFLHQRYLNWAASARRREISFSLTFDDIQKQWNEQQGKCYITEEQMVLQVKSDWTVSLDRVDSNSDYRLDNIKLCCLYVNKMKLDKSLECFKTWCGLVLR